MGQMYLPPRYGMQILGDNPVGQSYRPTETRPGQLFMSDLKDSGLYSNALTIKVEKEKLKVSISMYHYAPEEVKLEMVDGFVVIDAKHAERREKRCFIAREFKRRFALPKSTNIEAVRAKMSVYGWLTIVIPLINTGQPELWSPSGSQGRYDPKQKDDPEHKDDLKQKDDQKDAPESKVDSDKKAKEPKKGRPIRIKLIE